ncbi:MAG: type II toxin-antitoxin system VapC family toxin [Gallionella sp.]
MSSSHDYLFLHLITNYTSNDLQKGASTELYATRHWYRNLPATFSAFIGTALLLNWTRDPFDRIIAAQAAHRKSPLLTADQNMLKHYAAAIW